MRSTVRVTKTYKVKVTEYFDFEIIPDEREYRSPERLAEDLFRAMTAAGQDIDWMDESEIDDPNTLPEYDYERIPEIFEPPPDFSEVEAAPPRKPDPDLEPL